MNKFIFREDRVKEQIDYIRKIPWAGKLVEQITAIPIEDLTVSKVNAMVEAFHPSSDFMMMHNICDRCKQDIPVLMEICQVPDSEYGDGPVHLCQACCREIGSVEFP